MQDNNTQDLPFLTSPVLPKTFDASKVIQFQCRKGIACWNACCSNIDISLTPYDILRLKRRFGTSSGEFLKKYTVPFEFEQNSIAGVKLRPVANGTACQFMTPEGCSVYEDRPTACRYYPVALLSLRRQDESTDHTSYALVEEPHCLGHKEPRPISVGDYRKEQGLEEYDDQARGWRQLILKKKSSGPSIGKPSKRSLELFFMVCYDIDRFSQFVASEGFSDIYDLPAQELKNILCDDLELMQFGFRFLRQVLFGEESIPLRKEAAQERHLRQQERRQRLETEAAAKRALEQDEMYSDPEE
ncbi:YkgJ family cysteine cluster protein [Rhodoferax sp.]|uniref:YkgJ family cysteine cluster protein n=1 Tax=Rhodoferax sp. TaxID=50421 RepID=UPI002629CD52|nr:YkgJ family cysteine cluster protein [Rhodoferax sp.]MDD2917574.1 YkgJ family cysteine cluster protein [Rhodoferax sp.]